MRSAGGPRWGPLAARVGLHATHSVAARCISCRTMDFVHTRPARWISACQVDGVSASTYLRRISGCLPAMDFVQHVGSRARKARSASGAWLAMSTACRCPHTCEGSPVAFSRWISPCTLDFVHSRLARPPGPGWPSRRRAGVTVPVKCPRLSSRGVGGVPARHLHEARPPFRVAAFLVDGVSAFAASVPGSPGVSGRVRGFTGRHRTRRRGCAPPPVSSVRSVRRDCHQAPLAVRLRAN